MSGLDGIDSMTTTNTPNSDTTERNCSLFTHERELAAVTLGGAFLSLVACLIVLLLVCCLRKCHVLSQRLILYVVTAVVIRSLSWAQVATQFDVHPSLHERRSCSIAGYTLTLTGWFEFVSITCLSTNLLLNMVTKKSHRWQEVIYILFTFIVPFTVVWIPFVAGSYGKTGFYCWIRAQKDNTCDVSIAGLVFQFVLWYIPLLLALSHLLLLYCRVTWSISKRKMRWEGPNNRGINKPKLKEIRQLILFPLVYFLLHLLPLAAQLSLVFSPRHIYTLWFLSAITQPLQGGLVAIAFVLDNSTVRRLRRQNLSAAVRGLTQSGVIEDYPTHHAMEDQSYEQSEKISTSSFSDDDERSYVDFEEDKDSRERRAKYTKFSKD